MHEMSITVNIIKIVNEQMIENKATKLNVLKLKVGQMTAVEPDSLKFCFDATIIGTPLEGALLQIEEVPITGICSECNRNFEMENYYISTCPDCGGTAAEIVSGRELDIVGMEVD